MLQPCAIILTVLVVQAYSAPQFITFNEGKLGVNFGGYHAAVGLGGLGGNGRTAGGLFAEAGTPYGPAAKAGLGGSVDGSSGTAGGLYAGATAGGNVRASAGLGGAVSGGKAIGGGYSSAQSGPHGATAVLGGESGVSGSSGFSVTAHKSVEVPATIVKKTEVSVIPIEEVRKETKYEAANEIIPVANAGFEAHVNVNAQPGVVKEVHVEPTPTQVIVHKHKPHKHIHKTVYVGGYAGAGVDDEVVVKTDLPQRRVDVETEGGAEVTVNGKHYEPGKVVTFSNTKEVVVTNNAQAKPNTFFQDIFNIPISTLKAVSGFLTNTAGNTNVSVQKSASVQTGGYSGYSGYGGGGAAGNADFSSFIESDPITSKHDKSSSVQSVISVQTPNASSFIDDIFAIPINTLTAVNKFLENNVGGRKKVQVAAEGPGEPTRVRLGPYARRRAHKQVVIVQEPAKPEPQESN